MERWPGGKAREGGEKGNGTASEKKVRGKRKMEMGCFFERTEGGRQQGPRWLMRASWSRRLSPADGSATRDRDTETVFCKNMTLIHISDLKIFYIYCYTSKV